MSFAAPWRLLWLAGPGALALALWWRARRDRTLLARFGEPALVRALVDPAASRAPFKHALALAGLACLVVASARPQWGTALSEVRRRGNDVFVALDVSKSMLTEDVPPNRLEKAKRSLGLLLSSLEGDRVGVIAFAGDAFVQCPLTLDADAARLFLDGVSTDTVPVPGTALGRAVRRAIARFPARSGARKILVLLTDGEETGDSDPIAAAREAAAAGVTIYPVGIGTPQGDVIKLRDESGAVTGFAKDEKGGTVLSRLDEPTLTEMARLTGGRYVRCGTDDADLLALAAELSGHGGQTLTTRMYRVREERYRSAALLALLLLLAEFLLPLRTGVWAAAWAALRASVRRRFAGPGAAAALALLCALPAARARADYRGDLARGNDAFLAGRLEEARQAYFNAQAEAPEAAEVPYNIGNTYLAEQNTEEALKFYDQALALARSPLLKSIIAYNRGWALAAANRPEEAAAAFKDALRWNPNDRDAKYNLEWVRSPKRGKPQGGSPKPGKGQAGKGKPELSKEDAERVLEMVRDQERQARQAQADAARKRQAEKPGPKGKDW